MLWRQYRATLLGVLSVFGAAALLLVLTGLRIHAGYHSLGLDTCQPAGSTRCLLLADTFDQEYGGWAMFLPRFLEFIPAMVGAFAGAPLLAREYESGTFRFAWTQGTSRTRWVVLRVLYLAAAVTVLAFGFSLLFTWWFAPFEAYQGRMQSGQAFEIEGLVFAGRTLFGFCLGVLAGAVLRRTVPAIAATLTGWGAAVVPTVLFWRQHYQQPITIQVGDIGGAPRADWVLADWTTDPAGHRLATPDINRLIRGLFARGVDPRTWLPQHGYTSWVSYQPASRFWSFQLIEASVLCVLSLVLATAALQVVRRT
jgi:hypothetical protein